MKQILFIGAYEKSDILFYVAKLLSVEHSVLILDVTAHADYQYAYPKVEGQDGVRQHDRFDVIENATLETYQELQKESKYDFVLVDISRKDELQRWTDADQYYLVTSHDNAVMQRNSVLMNAFFQAKSQSDLIPIHKLIQESAVFPEEVIQESFTKHPIDWKESFIFYPDERDLESKYMNQHLSMMHTKKLSGDFKLALQRVTAQILGMTAKEAKGLWKQAERGK